MNRITIYIITLLFTSCCSTVAFGIDFKIDVVIQRPAIYQSSGSSQLRAKSPSTSSSVRGVPASFQYVEVYQNETFGSFIGSAFTDAEGTLKGVDFSVANHYPNQIRLVVYGDSKWGFRVGYNSALPWEQLNTAYAWQWQTPWIDAGTSVVDVGVLPLGKDGNSWVFLEDNPNTASDDNRVNSFRAAALVELLDMIYEELDISFMSSNWIINDVVANIMNSQAPWTYWNTVHIRDGLDTDYILESAPHEFGHVLYNLNHSGQLHYDAEDWMDYLHNHSACSDFGSHFGHYEGYANAFANLFWRHHAQRIGTTAYRNPSDHCPTLGIAREGNVNEFYSYAFAGTPMERPPESLYNWTTHLIGANNYSFPPTIELFEIVNNVLTEDLNQMWTLSMGSMCSGNTSGVPTFCGSRRFRCLVMNTMVDPDDTFPDQFKNVDCLPGESSIVNTTASPGSIRVEFTSADFVDSYEILVQPDGQSSTPTAVNANEFGKEILSQSVSVSNCDKVRLSVRTYNDYGSTQGDTIEVYTDCQMTKPVINNVSCSYYPPRDAITLPLQPPYESKEDDSVSIESPDEDYRNAPGDDSPSELPPLTELPATSGGFDCELSFTPSPEGEKHRYVLERTGYQTEYGAWMEYPDNKITFSIRDTEQGTNPRVAVEARKMITTVSSEFVPFQYPDIPAPELRLEMEMKRKTFIVPRSR